jgi:thiol-disulfide isomerase/thioredoxin
MKKLVLAMALGVFSFTSNAQTSLTEAVDFTVTFTDGEEFNLFDKLAEGKWVCIDWFFTTCGPCQANQPYYTEAFQNFGCNEGEIFFLSIENTVGDAAVITYEETYAGENAPPAASGTEGGGIDAENLYNIGAFPTFILINPDGDIVEQDMWPLTNGADTFAEYFGDHGLDPMPCATDVTEAEASVSVFPNPANNQVTVDLSGFTGNVSVDVYNLLGEVVSSVTATGNQTQVDVSALPAGNYVLQVADQNQTLQQQLTVIH